MPIDECLECEGTGALVTRVGWMTHYARCPKCDGTGVRVDFDDPDEKEPTE
jgi:DnaJ-class molecular chaperone